MLESAAPSLPTSPISVYFYFFVKGPHDGIEIINFPGNILPRVYPRTLNIWLGGRLYIVSDIHRPCKLKYPEFQYGLDRTNFTAVNRGPQNIHPLARHRQTKCGIPRATRKFTLSCFRSTKGFQPSKVALCAQGLKAVAVSRKSGRFTSDRISSAFPSGVISSQFYPLAAFPVLSYRRTLAPSPPLHSISDLLSWLRWSLVLISNWSVSRTATDTNETSGRQM